MGQSNRGSGLFRIGLLASASASALLAATPALAQPANQPPAPPVDQNAPPATTIATPPPATSVASEGDTAVTRNPNEIVVTGTRIRSPEFTSPDPVSRIDPATAQREGKLSLAETLQSSPIAAGSTQITSAISSNFVTNGGPGAQTIDLRGLGANRTLVLLNGRRAGPAGTRGGVSSFDLNVLPQSIVKQVDILKTGASSIYGSDAVAGVVNLITKTDFNGFQIERSAISRSTGLMEASKPITAPRTILTGAILPERNTTSASCGAKPSTAGTSWSRSTISNSRSWRAATANISTAPKRTSLTTMAAAAPT